MVFHLVGISLWVGGLVAFLGLARQHVKHLPVIARRYSSIALWAFIAVALSGFGNAWVRIDLRLRPVDDRLRPAGAAQGRPADGARGHRLPAPETDPAHDHR